MQDLHKHKHRQPCHLLLMGWQRQKVVSAATHMTLSRFTSTCTVTNPTRMSTAPLPTRHSDPRPPYLPRGSSLLGSWSSLVLTSKHSHPHPTGTPYSQVPPKYQHRPSTHLTTLRGPRASYSPAGTTWSLLLSYTCAHPLWGRYRCSAPVNRENHTGCDS